MTLAATVLLLAAAGWLALASMLPVLAGRRVNRYAAHVGTAAATPVPYRSPVDVLIAALAPRRLMVRYRKPIEYRSDFNWSGFVDRQAVALLAGAGIGLLVFHNVIPALLGAVLLPVGHYALAARRAHEYERSFLLQLPNALLLVGSAMAAGRNFANALEATIPNLSDPISSELASLLARIQALRVTEAQAFNIWAESLRYPELKTIASVLEIGAQVGLQTDVLLRSLSASIQGEASARAELDSLTSQVRISATVITYLPVAFVAVLYFLAPDFIRPLYTTWFGAILVAIAVIANVIGRQVASGVLRRIAA